MYIETSLNNHGNPVSVSFGQTDIIQISNVTFYYTRFSILTNDSLKTMGRFKIQLLLEDNTWSTRYNIPKSDRYSDTSTEWTLVSLNFTEKNYGFKSIYDEIDSAHADMCFSKITITRSVYWIITHIWIRIIFTKIYILNEQLKLFWKYSWINTWS